LNILKADKFPELEFFDRGSSVQRPTNMKTLFANHYRRCAIVFDEAKIHIDGLDNFASHYEPISDTYFANPKCGQATTLW
jgi:hypothetical protein